MAVYDKLLQVPRGTKARLETIKLNLLVNTIVYATDTKELGIKLSDGNIEYFMNAKDINAIVDILDTNKQDKLVAGDNITIDNNVISASGGAIIDLGTFNSHEELIMYAITEQIPTGQYAFFMGNAGHASLILVRDAGTYYEGMAQGSDGLYVIFNVTKQGQMREYGVLHARDIIASFDDIRSIFSELDDKVDNSRVLTDVPAGAKFTDTITTINGKTGTITKADIVSLGIPAQDTVDWQDLENKPELYNKTEIDLMLGDIEGALDAILGV